MNAVSATADFDRGGATSGRPPAIDAIANGFVLVALLNSLMVAMGVIDHFIRLAEPALPIEFQSSFSWTSLIGPVVFASLCVKVAQRVRSGKGARIEALVLAWLTTLLYGGLTVMFATSVVLNGRDRAQLQLILPITIVLATISIATLVRVERSVTIEYFARLKAMRARGANASA